MYKKIAYGHNIDKMMKVWEGLRKEINIVRSDIFY
jgi:hypothetical protein